MILIDNLSFCYAGQNAWALKDINLEIEPGECLILAGPSGCGKSTLAKAVNGLIPHFEKGMRAGRVLLSGKDLAEQPMHRIAGQVGAVFQNPRSQFFTTRVMDEVAFGGENAGLSRTVLKERVEASLARFRIEPLRESRVFDLSSGERQKAILAAIHAMGPAVWVLDEPSSNLDPASIRELGNVLNELKKEGKTLIIAEHRCHFLRDLADRVVIMDGGRVAETVSAEAFFDRSNQEMNQKGLRWVHSSQTPLSKNNVPPWGAKGHLSIQGLGFRYPGGTKDVLSNITLSAGSGEILALTGPNGAGKTTLAMIISGLYKARRGEIRIQGSPKTARERITLTRMVLQEADHQLFTESAFKELALAVNGMHRHEITALLEEIGLEAQSHQRPQSLSGGEKQRLAIAAALIAGPALLILDEPTSGLDAGNMRRLGRLLQRTADRGGLVLVVTHDREFIHTCCTREMRLDKGGIEHVPSIPN